MMGLWHWEQQRCWGTVCYCGDRGRHGLCSCAALGDTRAWQQVPALRWACWAPAAPLRRWHPLHVAAMSGNIELIRRLVQQFDCDLRVKSMNSWTPLHYAAAYNQVAVIEALISLGCEVAVQVGRRRGGGGAEVGGMARGTGSGFELGEDSCWWDCLLSERQQGQQAGRWLVV